MIYVTSDTHFGHANIIKYCGRPFADVHEMNEELIRRWNQVVSPDDEVWHLGDFGFLSRRRTAEVVERLNGTVHLIRGNHDRGSRIKNVPFASVLWANEIKWENRKIFLSHYPVESWPVSRICLHGHSHGNSVNKPGRLDVGVDCHDFRPITLARAVELIEAKGPREMQRGYVKASEL